MYLQITFKKHSIGHPYGILVYKMIHFSGIAGFDNPGGMNRSVASSFNWIRMYVLPEIRRNAGFMHFE